MAETRSTCCYCGVGCGVLIEHDATGVTGVRGDPDHPANRGRLCTKGSTLHLSAAPQLQPQLRALQPMHRAARGQPLQPLGWNAALDGVADAITRTVQAHGPDAVGLYLSGQLLTEDYWVFNKLAKGLLGTNNVDTNSRLCMSSAVSGYKQTLGADAPPACYDDLALAATVFVTGSNMAWAHPVLMRQLEDARRANPAQKLVVVDPRRTETAAVADLHLQLLPGTDVTLHHALLHLMLWEGLTDPAYIAAHTRGFEALRDRVREFTPALAARVCGLREDDIVQAARWFANVGDGGARAPTLSLYCQGLNQSSSGTDKNSSLINLHLATGQIGRPGAGPLSLTGQPNAMGGREVGGLATLLPGHREVADPAHRAEVAALWGLDSLPAQPGLSAVQLFEAAADGQLRLLWIVCTNPAHSLPDSTRVRRALERADCVIVQDAYAHTATAAFADWLLPASSWAEKDGTVTNSERVISRVRRAVAPPGQARDDWRIAVDVARRLEQRLGPRRRDGGTLFPYDSAESIWNEHRESTRGRDLDITGLDWARLEQQGPQAWPFPQGSSAGRARLYTDGRFATADGRARFTAPAPRPLAELRDARHPFSLTTGRLRDQWHGMSRTGSLGRLFAHESGPVVELNPQDMARRGWRDGELLRLASRRGTLVLPARGNETLRPTLAFVAMHWGPEWLAGPGVNTLLPAAACPVSRQPELKHAALHIERAELPWALVAAAWLPAEQALALRAQLLQAAAGLAFACATPFGREPAAQVGLLLRAAGDTPLSRDQRARIEGLLGLQAPDVLRYDDARAGRHRAMRLAADGTLQAFVLAGDAAASGWALDWLQQRQPAASSGRALLAGGRTPPQALAPRSPQVCSCLDISEARIVQALAQCPGSAEQRLQSLQQGLRCGTQCGSCVPALKVLVQRHPAVVGGSVGGSVAEPPAEPAAEPDARLTA